MYLGHLLLPTWDMACATNSLCHWKTLPSPTSGTLLDSHLIHRAVLFLQIPRLALAGLGYSQVPPGRQPVFFCWSDFSLLLIGSTGTALLAQVSTESKGLSSSSSGRKQDREREWERDGEGIMGEKEGREKQRGSKSEKGRKTWKGERSSRWGWSVPDRGALSNWLTGPWNRKGWYENHCFGVWHIATCWDSANSIDFFSFFGAGKTRMDTMPWS